MRVLTVNEVTLIGGVVKAPEKRTFENGNQRVSFPFVTTRYYNAKNGKEKEHKSWHTIVIKNKALGDYMMRTLVPGSQLRLKGEIEYENWLDNPKKPQSETNKRNYKTVILAYSSQWAAPKPGGSKKNVSEDTDVETDNEDNYNPAEEYDRTSTSDGSGASYLFPDKDELDY